MGDRGQGRSGCDAGDQAAVVARESRSYATAFPLISNPHHVSEPAGVTTQDSGTSAVSRALRVGRAKPQKATFRPLFSPRSGNGVATTASLSGQLSDQHTHPKGYGCFAAAGIAVSVD